MLAATEFDLIMQSVTWRCLNVFFNDNHSCFITLCVFSLSECGPAIIFHTWVKLCLFKDPDESNTC